MTKGREVSFTIQRKRAFKTVFQFKLTLIGTKPPVWRRIQVPDSYTFYDLHVAIQNAMGWTDSHLHAYEIPGKCPVRIESPYAADELSEEARHFTTETPLIRFFKRVGGSAVYEYDFGDGWRHEVLLENILPRKTGIKYPACLAGQRACPPEDCGGISGYADCVKAAAGKNSDLLAWLDGWTPEGFNPKDIVFEDPAKRFLDSFEEE